MSHGARHGHLQLPGGLPAGTAGLCGVCWPGRWAWGPLTPELPVGCSQAGRWLSSTVVVSPLFTPPPCPSHPPSGHCATLSSHSALSFTVCLVPATVLTAVQLLNLHILLQEEPPRHHVVHSAFDILTFLLTSHYLKGRETSWGALGIGVWEMSFIYKVKVEFSINEYTLLYI